MAPNVLDDDQLASGLRADGIAGVIHSSITAIIGWFVAKFIPSVGETTGVLIGGMIGALSYFFFAINRNKKRAVQLELNKELRVEMAVQFSSTLSDIDDSSKLQEWNKIKLEIASSILTESNQRILERELIVKHTISETVNVSGVAEETYGELYAEKLDMQKMNIELEKKLKMVEKENDDTRKELLAKESIDLAEVMKSNGFQFTTEQLTEIGFSAILSGNLEFGKGSLLQALNTASISEDQFNVTKCLVGLGNIAKTLGDLEEAERLYRECLVSMREIGHKEGETNPLIHLGLIAYARGDLDEAERFQLESLVIAREVGDKVGEAGSLINLGNIARIRDDLVGSKKFYLESLSLMRENGNRRGKATVLQNLGVIAESRGDLDEAESFALESLDIMREIGDRLGVSAILNNLGIIADSREDFIEAERYYRESLAIDRKIGHKIGVAHSQINLGIILGKRDALDEAECLFQESLSLSREVGRLETELKSLNNLGEIAKIRGDLEEAARLRLESLAIKRKIGITVDEEE